MRIGLVFGGNTTEGEVSKVSAAGVRGALNKLGYDVIDIEFDKNVAMHIQDANVDIVFNAMHGQYGEDGCLQGLLDIMQIPYTHSGRLASAVAMNKVLSKQIFKDIGLKVARGFTVTKEELRNDVWKQKITTSDIAECREFFVKPVQDGSSVDSFLIHDVDSYSFKMTDFKSTGDLFLVEERIVGREIEVVVLENKAIGMLEVCPKHEFYDFDSKYSENGAIHKPVDANDVIRQKLSEYAEKIHNAIGLKDVSRSEFILTEENDDIYVLEVNSHPGFTPTSIVPEVAMQAGKTYEEIVEMLVKNAKFG